MDIVILLFDGFEPLDAIGPYEILAHVPGAKVRFVAPESGRITDVLGSLQVDVAVLVPGGKDRPVNDAAQPVFGGDVGDKFRQAGADAAGRPGGSAR